MCPCVRVCPGMCSWPDFPRNLTDLHSCLWVRSLTAFSFLRSFASRDSRELRIPQPIH